MYSSIAQISLILKRRTILPIRNWRQSLSKVKLLLLLLHHITVSQETLISKPCLESYNMAVYHALSSHSLISQIVPSHPRDSADEQNQKIDLAKL